MLLLYTVFFNRNLRVCKLNCVKMKSKGGRVLASARCFGLTQLWLDGQDIPCTKFRNGTRAVMTVSFFFTLEYRFAWRFRDISMGIASLAERRVYALRSDATRRDGVGGRIFIYTGPRS